MTMLMSFLSRLRRDEDGQGMVEYGLILALVAVVVIGALALLGDESSALFTDLLGNF